MMVFHHPINVEVLDSDMPIVLSIVRSHLVVEITALALDLQMRLRCTPGSEASAFTVLLPTSNRALLASQRSLALTIVAGVLDDLSFTISQEGFQPYVDAEIRMRTFARAMLCLWFSFTDNQSVPVTISTQDKIGRLGGSFDGAMEFDFDGATQLLGDGKVLAIGSKREISLVLSQLDRVPLIGFLKAGEPHVRDAQFFSSKKPFESSTQPIREHLNGRRGNMFPTTCEVFVQIVFRGECSILLVLCLKRREHLIVDMPRLDQALHEQVLLVLIWVDSVLKRFHVLHFNRRSIKLSSDRDCYQIAPTPNKERGFYPHS